MKLVKSEMKVEIYGQELTLRKPTYLESREYREELKKLNPDEDAIEVMKNYLIKLGLTEKIFLQLEVGHILEVMDLISDSKKK